MLSVDVLLDVRQYDAAGSAEAFCVLMAVTSIRMDRRAAALYHLRVHGSVAIASGADPSRKLELAMFGRRSHGAVPGRCMRRIRSSGDSSFRFLDV